MSKRKRSSTPAPRARARTRLPEIDWGNNDMVMSYTSSMNMPSNRDDLVLADILKNHDVNLIPSFWYDKKKLPGWEGVTGPNLGEYLLENLDKKKVNVFTPAIGSTGRSTHYITVVIYPKKRGQKKGVVDIFDPGYGVYSALPMIKIIIKTLKEEYNRIEFRDQSLNDIKVQMSTGDIFCQTYVIWYTYELFAKGKSAEQIRTELKKMPSTHKAQMVKNFANYLIRTYPELERDMIADMKNSKR